jgi:hypothetical protein
LNLLEIIYVLLPKGVSFEGEDKIVKNAPGFKTIYKAKVGGVTFADLLQVSPNFYSIVEVQ